MRQFPSHNQKNFLQNKKRPHVYDSKSHDLRPALQNMLFKIELLLFSHILLILYATFGIIVARQMIFLISFRRILHLTSFKMHRI